MKKECQENYSWMSKCRGCKTPIYIAPNQHFIMVLSNTKFRILFTIPIVVLLFSISHASNSPLIVGFHHHYQPHPLHESHRLFYLMTLNIGTQEQEVPFETMKCISSLYGKTQSYNRCFIVSIGKEYLWICSLCYGQVCLHNNNFTTLLWVTFNPKKFDSFLHILYLFHVTHVLLLACKVEPQQWRCLRNPSPKTNLWLGLYLEE